MLRQQCINCPFKDDEYNLYKRGDTIVIGKKKKEYCGMFDKGIPQQIVKDKVQCEYKQIATASEP